MRGPTRACVRARAPEAWDGMGESPGGDISGHGVQHAFGGADQVTRQVEGAFGFQAVTAPMPLILIVGVTTAAPSANCELARNSERFVIFFQPFFSMSRPYSRAPSHMHWLRRRRGSTHRSITSASRPSRARARASHPLSQEHTTTHVHTHTLRTHTNKGRIPHPPDQEFVASV